MFCFLDAEWLKTMHTPPAEPLSRQKRTGQSLYPIFTSSPISTCFKRPIIKEKVPSNSSQHLESSNHAEHGQEISSPQKKTEAACLKQEAGDNSSEIKVEPHNLAPEPFTVTTPPSCESESPSADNPDEDVEDEDQTVFFTPELFDGEGNEGSPQKETKTKSPSRMVSGLALLSGELFGSEQAQGQASAFDGQSAISGSKDSTELSQGQKEEIRGQKQGEEEEQVDNQTTQSGSKLRRLSRSRQKAPSTHTGN